VPRSTGFPFIPPLASTGAYAIEAIIWAVNIVAAFFSLLIVVAIVYFAVKYRRGHQVDRSNPVIENLPIEIAWTVIPLAIAMGLFVWATAVFLANKRIPSGASEIYVVGKQWMWKLQHPEGRWEMNELHVPVGRAIKLTMTSEDVIHSFFVPAFRVHQDVIPGQYTHLWFTPSLVGTYPLYCAQFCGTNHSGMVGTVTVMSPADYQDWLTTGRTEQSLAQAGATLFVQKGCAGCHMGGSVRAPRLEGIYGKPVPVQIPPGGVNWQDLAVGTAVLQRTPGTTLIADDRYIHDSILLPEKEIAAGYYPVMPSFKGQIDEAQIVQLTAYIKSLANTIPSNPRAVSQGPATRTVPPEEYQARVGFVPANVKKAGGGR
jgi:cytochrome c oxidase subunit II